MPGSDDAGRQAARSGRASSHACFQVQAMPADRNDPAGGSPAVCYQPVRAPLLVRDEIGPMDRDRLTAAVELYT